MQITLQRRSREVIADVLAIVLGSEMAGEKNSNLERVKCRRELATESSGLFARRWWDLFLLLQLRPFFGKPEMARYLGGSEVGFEMPGLGVFHGPNLTPDSETGLGNWTIAQIVTAIQTGKRPDGRELAPIMPWRAFANLTKDDVTAIAVFLKSIPAVKNRVPGPFGANDKATEFVMKVVPGEGKK